MTHRRSAGAVVGCFGLAAVGALGLPASSVAYVKGDPVNFYLRVQDGGRLSHTTSGTLSALANEDEPVKVAYTALARFGVGDSSRQIPKAAARVNLKGMAGEPRTIHIRLRSSQLAAVRRQAARANRRSVLLRVEFRGTLEGEDRVVKRKLVFRLRI